MRRYAMFAFWLAMGVYSVITAIGGSEICAGMAMLCGYMARDNMAVEGSNG